MEPTLYRPVRSVSTRLKGILNALVVERRLPHRIAQKLDRYYLQCGSQFKTMRLRGVKLKMRRGTSDLTMACDVFAGEYLRPGYEIAPTDTVIDIGGNIGAFAIYAARSAHRGRVLTFEPCRESYSLLLENLALNHIAHVCAAPAAVGAANANLTLYVDGTHTGRASLQVEHVKEVLRQEAVSVVSLQSVFDDHKIDTCDLLKLDCEGAEYDILYSLPEAYYSRIRRIVMEYHGEFEPTSRQAKARELVEFLISRQFQIDVFSDNIDSDCGWIFARR